MEDQVTKRFSLKGTVNSKNAKAIRPVLKSLITNGTVKEIDGAFEVEAEMEGMSAKDLNRTLLSALRKLEKRTTIRAEWTSGKTIERYFDYVLKKTIKI
jgi:hypothetical protein